MIFSSESALCIRWPRYWSFSFRIFSSSKEYSGLISFRIDWFDLLEVQGILRSPLQHHSSTASVLRHSAFFIVQLSHPYMTTGKSTTLIMWTFIIKVMSLLFNMFSMFVIAFLSLQGVKILISSILKNLAKQKFHKCKLLYINLFPVIFFTIKNEYHLRFSSISEGRSFGLFPVVRYILHSFSLFLRTQSILILLPWALELVKTWRREIKAIWIVSFFNVFKLHFSKHTWHPELAFSFAVWVWIYPFLPLDAWFLCVTI